jgi:hypothetical protein
MSKTIKIDGKKYQEVVTYDCYCAREKGYRIFKEVEAKPKAKKERSK